MTDSGFDAQLCKRREMHRPRAFYISGENDSNVGSVDIKFMLRSAA